MEEVNLRFYDLIGKFKGNLTVFNGTEILRNRYHNKTYLEQANLNPSLNSDYKKDKLDTDSKPFGIISLAQRVLPLSSFGFS
jgi:hypothetical protein